MASLDPVKRDGVVKEQVAQEQETAALWDKKWNFMMDYYDILVEEAAEEGWSAEQFNRYKTKLKGTRILPKHTEKPRPSGPLPITSSGMIGWRSSRLENSCEIFGPLYVSPRHTMQPPDVPLTPRQNHIKLG